MQAESFDVSKKVLSEFDQNILTKWKEQLILQTDSTFYSYVIDVPNFPPDKDALKVMDDDLTLERIALDADKGEDVDMSVLTLAKIQKKFAFPPTPCERPLLVKKKKKSKKKKSKSEHSKRTPRSESTTFGPSKK